VTVPFIRRKYHGKSDPEIYRKVDGVMERLASELGLTYETDAATRSGKVAKMGISGKYAVKAGEVTVELAYPMLVPGSLRKKVEDKIESHLQDLFA
jgi:hypothetical protein